MNIAAQKEAYKAAHARLMGNGQCSEPDRVDRTVRAPKATPIGRRWEMYKSPYGEVRNVVKHTPQPVWWSVGDEAVD